MTSLRARIAFTSLAVSTFVACSGTGARYATGPSCEERQQQLVSVLQSLPDETLTTQLHVALPSATLAGSFGKGAVIELTDATVSFNGQAVTGNTRDDRLTALASVVPPAPSPSTPLYVAATSQLDMRTLQAYLGVLPEGYDLRLAFARQAPAPEAPQAEAEDQSSVYAEKLLLERDPAARRRIASEGYAAYSSCEPVNVAAVAHQAAPEGTRWASLKRAMLDAVPRCACSELDPDGLRQLLVAEQRAGNVALGSMPADFLKDIRCSASMPLRTVQQVLDDVEKFEAEFSGTWDETGVRFDEVVTNERLLNYLCTAMPGEVFEYVSAHFATVYVRHAKSPKCHAYRLEPVARGAVFGSLRSLETSPDAPGSFHYRLGGNDLRVYGPTPTPQSHPTDDGPWTCNKDLKLTHVDSGALDTEGGGRIYFTKQACAAAAATQAFSGCPFDPTLSAALPETSPTPASGEVAPAASP